MKDNVWSIVIKLALFMAIASLIVFLMVTPYTAEWYILIFTIVLNVALCAIVHGMLRFKERKESRLEEKEGGKK
ncbi:MAG: hypothetical protein J6C93_07435 [Clostridia bacterium]|nr:hypothetical protein [Clostridia bacterium]